MHEHEIELLEEPIIICWECGTQLEVVQETENDMGQPQTDVRPCPKCLAYG